eukprot:gene25569-biopygen23999
MTRPRYRIASGHGYGPALPFSGIYSWGPNPRHMAAAVVSSPPGVGVDIYAPALQVTSPLYRFGDVVAGAPTPDIWGGVLIGAVYGPALQDSGARAVGYGPALQAPWRSPTPPTGPPYRLRARATGRGRTSPPGVAHPQGVRGLIRASPPGVCMAFRAMSFWDVGAHHFGGQWETFTVSGPYNGRGRIIRPGGLTGCGPGERLRARPTGNAPALQVRGRIAGGPTPDIWRGRRASPPGAGPHNSPYGAHGQCRVRRLLAY